MRRSPQKADMSEYGPCPFSEQELERVVVHIRDFSRGILNCNSCERGWAYMLRPGGKLPRGYWRCPEGCNSPE
jgi:hypothetical protein